MTVLYLVRHGETVANAAQILQGQTQGELNAKGIEQAEEVRDKMRSERFDAFVASDLRRSVRTCEIIAEPHHQPVVTTRLLRERDWGDFTGKFIPDLREMSPWPANVETLEAIKARADRFIAWLRSMPIGACWPWDTASSIRPFRASTMTNLWAKCQRWAMPR